jgi:hypothetical protein
MRSSDLQHEILKIYTLKKMTTFKKKQVFTHVLMAATDVWTLPAISTLDLKELSNVLRNCTGFYTLHEIVILRTCVL